MRGARAAKATPPRSPSKASSTLSKRQEKKSRAQGRRERKGALLSQLETRKEADAAAAWSFPGWLAGPGPGRRARRGRAAGRARRDKNRPNAANNRGRRVIAAQETERSGAVLKDARFRADPLGAVLGHLRATLPAPPPSGRRKKGVSSVFCARLFLRPVTCVLAFASVLQGLAWLLSSPQSHQFDAKQKLSDCARLIASLPTNVSSQLHN